jgi:hypothetical protein
MIDVNNELINDMIHKQTKLNDSINNMPIERTVEQPLSDSGYVKPQPTRTNMVRVSDIDRLCLTRYINGTIVKVTISCTMSACKLLDYYEVDDAGFSKLKDR